MSLAITTTSISLPANQPVLYQMAASGASGPVLWALQSGTRPPGGLSMDKTGRILGTAGITGTFTFVAAATDTGALDPSEGGEAMHTPGPTVGATITLTLS